MSSTSTAQGEGTAFPFNNESQSNQWPPFSIIGVVLTVLAFIAVVCFIFWIFKREKKWRQCATTQGSPPEARDREFTPSASFDLRKGQRP